MREDLYQHMGTCWISFVAKQEVCRISCDRRVAMLAKRLKREVKEEKEGEYLLKELVERPEKENG